MHTAWGSDRVIAGAGEDRAVCAGNRLSSVKERDNAWGKEGDCDCLIPDKLGQQRNKRAVFTNKSSVSKSEWMDAAVPVFHIKHC